MGKNFGGNFFKKRLQLLTGYIIMRAAPAEQESTHYKNKEFLMIEFVCTTQDATTTVCMSTSTLPAIDTINGFTYGEVVQITFLFVIFSFLFFKWIFSIIGLKR